MPDQTSDSPERATQRRGEVPLTKGERLAVAAVVVLWCAAFGVFAVLLIVLVLTVLESSGIAMPARIERVGVYMLFGVAFLVGATGSALWLRSTGLRLKRPLWRVSPPVDKLLRGDLRRVRRQCTLPLSRTLAVFMIFAGCGAAVACLTGEGATPLTPLFVLVAFYCGVALWHASVWTERLIAETERLRDAELEGTSDESAPDERSSS